MVVQILTGPTKQLKRTETPQTGKGTTKNLLNTAKYNKEPDNPKPNPNLKSFVVHWSVIDQFEVLCHTSRCLVLVSPLSLLCGVLVGPNINYTGILF